MGGSISSAQGLTEVVRMHLTFSPNAGWYLGKPGGDSVPFGESKSLALDSTPPVSVVTEKERPTLVIGFT